MRIIIPPCKDLHFKTLINFMGKHASHEINFKDLIGIFLKTFAEVLIIYLFEYICSKVKYYSTPKLIVMYYKKTKGMYLADGHTKCLGIHNDFTQSFMECTCTSTALPTRPNVEYCNLWEYPKCNCYKIMVQPILEYVSVWDPHTLLSIKS